MVWWYLMTEEKEYAHLAIDPELHQKLKITAVKERKSIKDLAEAILEEGLAAYE